MLVGIVLLVFMGLFKYRYGLRKFFISGRVVNGNLDYDWRLGLMIGIEVSSFVYSLIDFRLDN